MNTTILYYDCFSGISGDMNLGALVDLGVPEEYLKTELKNIGVDGFSLHFNRTSKHGIHGIHTRVLLESLPNQSERCNNTHHHAHEHRTFKDILDIINASTLSDAVKNRSTTMFRAVATAEAKIHNQPVEHVHFHEVGALDSIVDIVGAAICLEYLKPDCVLSSTVELGSGFVECEHGILPVPAPATLEILKGARVKSDGVAFEATTPTGAAILSANVEDFTDNKHFVIQKIGYGIGHKDGKIPNVLRVILAEKQSAETVQEDRIIECNIDDMNPEIYGYLSDRLFAAEASDVFFTPVMMKKNRPGTKISVLSRPETVQNIMDILFEETTTFGIRHHAVEKTMLNRRVEELETSLGKVRIKTGYRGEKRVKAKPEYESCRQIAEKQGLSLLDVYHRVHQEIQI